jgi:hypothetical protein
LGHLALQLQNWRIHSTLTVCHGEHHLLPPRPALALASCSPRRGTNTTDIHLPLLSTLSMALLQQRAAQAESLAACFVPCTVVTPASDPGAEPAFLLRPRHRPRLRGATPRLPRQGRASISEQGSYRGRGRANIWARNGRSVGEPFVADTPWQAGGGHIG